MAGRPGEPWRSSGAEATGWLAATVHDPSAGYVAVRSTIIDVKGNSTVQTIYRADGIR
jgi:hypothetical protein